MLLHARKILALIFIGASMISYAQQKVQYTQYMANYFVLNPAVAGSEDFIDVALGYRNQWVGFEDAPVTYYFSGHTFFGKDINNSHDHRTGESKSHHGAGLYAYNDLTGPTSRSAGYVSYAFHLPIARETVLSMGTFIGMQQFRVDGDALRFNEEGEPDALVSGMQVDTKPDASLGLWLNTPNYYVGLSGFQLLRNKWDLENTPKEEDGYQNRHYFLTAGYKTQINEELMFIPSFMIKAIAPAPLSVDLNARVKYFRTQKNEKTNKRERVDIAWGGLSYRGMDSFSALVGVTIARYIDLSYAFDLTQSDLRYYNNGTHEIILQAKIPVKGRLVCPSRYWAN